MDKKNSHILKDSPLDMNSYQIIDSGDRQKLEQVGHYRIIRPATKACYPKSLPHLWEKDIDGIYIRSDEGGGHWEYQNLIPQQFPVKIQNFNAYTKLTGFGHIGFFPEHLTLWNLILNLRVNKPEEVNLLNLFAYTGLSTIACVKKGFHVCHVDSSKGMIELAKMNMKLNNLPENAVRWMVEDVKKFVKREIKRGKHYDAFILDPPSFGRGPKNEIWKLERDISTLFDDLMILCKGSPLFVFLTCYSSNFTPLILKRILQAYIKTDGIFISGELVIKETSGHIFSSGGSCGIFLQKQISPDNITIFHI